MKHLLFGVLAGSALSGIASAQQMNCDCTVIVGSCEASIKVKPTGSAGSYGAELTFTSTAPICSKISYYVDSTPYFNILSRGNTDQDSVFGTKPITRDTISEVKCQVCQQTAAVRPDAGQHPGQATDKPLSPAVITGRWKDKFGEFHEFSVSGSNLSGSVWASGHNRLAISSGSVNGLQFDYAYTDYGGRNTTFSCKLQSATTAECSYRASGFLIIPGRSGTTPLTKE